MQCAGCGHDFPETLSRCPRCHRYSSSPKRIPASNESRLLEFPRRPRAASETDALGSVEPQPARSVPAWRVELNERVRAVRAKRAHSASLTDEPSANCSAATATARQPEAERIEISNSAQRLDAEPIESADSGPESRTNETILEAALSRVRRAEPASRASMPKVEGSRKVTANAFMVGDREATARALELQPEASPYSSIPAPEPEQTDAAEVEARPVFVGEEIEPKDYLEAEIRKVDRALAAEFARNESPSLAVHCVIGLIDLLVIAVSSAPFMILIGSTGGFAPPRSRVAAAAIVVLISFFYLTVTQALCGKTFGMMMTNTRVVNATSFESISPGRALARTIGYFVAVAPAAIGFLWMVINRKRRGWHDLLSGSLVARDF